MSQVENSKLSIIKIIDVQGIFRISESKEVLYVIYAEMCFRYLSKVN